MKKHNIDAVLYLGQSTDKSLGAIAGVIGKMRELQKPKCEYCKDRKKVTKSRAWGYEPVDCPFCVHTAVPLPIWPVSAKTEPQQELFYDTGL